MVTVTELNRAPDGRFESLEATDSLTDPAGISYDGAINPVQVTEEASTFTESDITITHNKTIVSNGSIKLGGGSIVSRPDDNDTISGGSAYGLVINPNEDLSGVKVELSKNMSNIQDVLITDTSENILAEKTAGYSAGDTVKLDTTLTSGTDYYLSVYNDGSDYTIGRYDNASFPYTSSSIDLVDGVFNSHPDDGNAASTIGDYAYALNNVQALTEPNSGDVVVEWDSGVPADLNSYDLATFQRTLDSETVTIDVEDGNGNVLFSDISQNFDISTVDTSKEVKLRANLSRNDTSNNPTVDYVARRFNRS